MSSTSKQRWIDSRMWDTDYFLSNHRDVRLTYVVTFTNASTNLSGCYQIGLWQLALRCGMTVDELRPCLEKLESDGKLIFRDGWILVRNMIDHQQLTSPAIVTGILKILQDLPEWAKTQILADYPELVGGPKTVPPPPETVPGQSKTVVGHLNINSDSDSDSEDLKPLSPAGDEIRTENFGTKTGMKVSDVLGQPSRLATVIEGLRERKKTIVALPKEFEWVTVTEAGFKNGYAAEHMLEVYDLLEKIRIKKGGRWRITPANWETNIPHLEELRDELKEIEDGLGNGGKDKRGSANGGNAPAAGGSERRTFKSPEVKRRSGNSS